MTDKPDFKPVSLNLFMKAIHKVLLSCPAGHVEYENRKPTKQELYIAAIYSLPDGLATL